MPTRHLAAMVLTFMIAWPAGAAAERTTTISRATAACVNWAAWREHGLASLTPRGARLSKLCPIRLPARTKIVVIEEDAGAGASEIRHRGRSWFVDAQNLD